MAYQIGIGFFWIFGVNGIQRAHLPGKGIQLSSVTGNAQEFIVEIGNILFQRLWRIPLGVDGNKDTLNLLIDSRRSLKKLERFAHSPQGKGADVGTVCVTKKNKAPFSLQVIQAKRFTVGAHQLETRQILRLPEEVILNIFGRANDGFMA